MVLKFVIMGIGAIILLTQIPNIKNAFASNKETQDPVNVDSGNNGFFDSIANIFKSNEIKEKSPPIQIELIERLPLESTPKRKPTEVILPRESVSLSDRLSFERKLAKDRPDLTQNTSIRNAKQTRGTSIKRDNTFQFSDIGNLRKDLDSGKVANTSTFNQAVIREQQKAEQLFASLFGNVANPKFATGGK